MYNYVEAICRHTLVVKQQVQALQEIVTSARTLKFVIITVRVRIDLNYINL